MADKVGVAVVGCGGMGKTHARLLAKFDDVRLVALVDVRQEAAMELKGEVGAASATSDLGSVLNDDSIDLVLICTHHHLHAPMCISAAQAGKHIFCEKPLALTIEECQKIAKEVQTAGVKFMVGFQARFSPFVLKLKEVVPKPWVTIAQLVDPKWDDKSWANDPVEGGGNVLSQGCHCFDATCFLSGSQPVSIYAGGGNFHHPTLPITDTVACTLRFDSGGVANVTIGDCGKSGLMGKASYQLFAGDMTATLFNYYSQPEIRLWGRDPERITMADLGCEDSLTANGYTGEMRALIDWVGKDLYPSHAAKVEDGLRATALGVKAIESIRTHRPQEI
jgi:predicted dehydrogenase